MTYLDLINEVLTRLREDQITTGDVDSNPYFRSIGAHVNDAKRRVENAWSWSCNRQTDTVALTEGVRTVELPNSGDQTFYELQSIFVGADGVTTPRQQSYVRRITKSQLRNQYLGGAVANDTPAEFAFDGRDATSGNLQITMVPPPAADLSLEVDCVRQQGPLTAATDVLLVPSLPVYSLATALASRERGEVGGAPTSELFSLANTYLADAIQQDSRFYEEELDWTGGISRPYNTNIRNY